MEVRIHRVQVVVEVIEPDVEAFDFDLASAQYVVDIGQPYRIAEIADQLRVAF